MSELTIRLARLIERANIHIEYGNTEAAFAAIQEAARVLDRPLHSPLWYETLPTDSKDPATTGPVFPPVQ